jgi:hypothetical protein
MPMSCQVCPASRTWRMYRHAESRAASSRAPATAYDRPLIKRGLTWENSSISGRALLEGASSCQRGVRTALGLLTIIAAQGLDMAKVALHGHN